MDVSHRYVAKGRWTGWTFGSEITEALVDQILIGMYANQSFNGRVTSKFSYTNKYYYPQNAVEGYVNQIGRYVDEFVNGDRRDVLEYEYLAKWLRENDAPVGAPSVFQRVLQKLRKVVSST